MGLRLVVQPGDAPEEARPRSDLVSGPDEAELLPELVRDRDRVVSGPWNEVLEAHQSSLFGVTNDTVHMHIRAHSGVQTVALFLTSEVAHWGSYPGNVCCLRPMQAAGGVAMVLEALRNLGLGRAT